MSIKNGFSKLALALLLSAPAMAMAIGAIAVDDEEGSDEPGYGFVSGYDSKEAARKAALGECKKAGNDDCQVVLWFETCGAYAASEKFYGTGWGATLAKAEGMALEKCGDKSCKVVVSDCE